MNWWSILGPILLEIVNKIIARRSSGGAAAAFTLNDHADMDRWAAQLEAMQTNASGAGGAARGVAAGLVTDVQQLIAALKAHDYGTVIALVQKILFG